MCDHDSQQLIRKLDSSWHGLFKALSNQGRQLDGAEEWIKAVMSCSYVDKPCWETLLADLRQMEPTIENNQLSLKAIFVLFSTNLQRHLLTVLFHHRQSMCKTSLKEFLSVIKDYVCVRDVWIDKLFNCLLSYVELSDEKNHVFNPYQFCSSNNKLYQSVLTTLKTKAVAPWQINRPSITDLFVKLYNTESLLENSPELFADGQLNDNQTLVALGQHEDIVEIIDKLARMPEQCTVIKSEVDNSESIIISSDEEEDNVKKRKIISYATCESEPPLKVVKADTKILTYTNITTDIKVKLDKLKDCWIKEEEGCLEEFDLFITSSHQQVMSFCLYLTLWKLEDECLAVICDNLVSKSNILNYENVVTILSYSIKPKFSQLNQSASRMFISVINHVAKIFPKQLIDVLVTETDWNSNQSDIICRICSESLQQSDCQYLLSKLVKKSKMMTEPIISVFQSLIEQKVDMSSDVTSNLIGCLSVSAVEFSNNNKFGKFMLHFINKYGQQLKLSDVCKVQVILDQHVTFLKKPALTALKKIVK